MKNLFCLFLIVAFLGAGPVAHGGNMWRMAV